MPTLSVIDDDRMLLDGLAAWLAAAPDLRLVTAVPTVDELLQTTRERAEVAVLDLVLADGSDPVRNVRRLVAAGYRVLVVSVVRHSRPAVEVLRAGALGYLTKNADLATLAAAVRDAARGQVVFTPELAFALARDSSEERPTLSSQERTVLLAYASGLTLAAAAQHAGIKPATAKKYLDQVKEKYCRAGRPTSTKLDLASRVREDGLLRYPQPD
jgi:two-component system nitrate/nitrite response regulator NarL